MRVPYSWLREVVAGRRARAGTSPPSELEQTLVRIGHEVEEVVTLGPVDGPLTVGRVTAIEELTEFKKPIRACLVDVGSEAGPREIVCGATNFAVGDLVVVALPGSHAARRLCHRRPQDLRPQLRRNDLLGGRTRLGRRPFRDSGAAARNRRTGRRRRRRARARRRGLRPGHHPRPRLLHVGARHGPRDRLRLRPGLRRPGGRAAAAGRRRGLAADGAGRRPACAGSRCARSPESIPPRCRRGGCSAGCCCPASARPRRPWT